METLKDMKIRKVKPRKNPAEARKEAFLYYETMALYYRGLSDSPFCTEEQKKEFVSMYKRCVRAKEAAKLDIIAADRIYYGIEA